MKPKTLLVTSVASGALGGIVVVISTVGVLAAVAHLDVTTRTVTVQEVPTTTANPAAGSIPNARRVYERDAPGVVLVSARNVSLEQTSAEFLKGDVGEGQGVATGTGFEIDGSGTILTNWHVVEGAAKVTVETGHGKAISASVVGKDPSHDIAVLRISTAGLILRPLVLGDSKRAYVGDPVLAIGNPFGLMGTLTTGVVSAIERNIRAPNGLTIRGSCRRMLRSIQAIRGARCSTKRAK
jgi:S1-C subfamily serine protease